MLPQPIIPRFFPVTSVPFIDDFSHFPSCVVLSAKGICLAVERIKVIACSAVVIEFPNGVFITIFPLSVADDISMLSTPMPALPITFSFLDFSITFLVAFVADLTTKASQSFNS